MPLYSIYETNARDSKKSYSCLILIFIFQRGSFVSEPAILVKRKSEANQVWSIEKLDLKLIDMRELYEDLKVSDGIKWVLLFSTSK